MKNVVISVEGHVLTITVDIAKEFGPSALGKTVASTEDSVDVPGSDVKVGLNCYKSPGW